MTLFGTGTRLSASKPNRAGNELGKIASAVINFNVGTPFTVDVVSLPIGAIIKRVWVEVITAFNAVTTNVLLLGHATTDDAYLAAGDVDEATPAVYPTGSKGPFPALTAARIVKAKYTQTGTAATTGQAKAYVEYVLP